MSLGVVFVAGAIVAGGLTAAGVELPTVDSLPRQVLLGLFGGGLMALSFVVRTHEVPENLAPVASTLGPAPGAPVPGVAPRVTRYFAGRDALLVRLHEMMEQEGLVVLTGLGGVGKTQLALTYLRSYRQEDERIWWLRAEDPAVLAEDYAALADAEQLAGPTAAIPAKIAVVRRFLDQTPGWLLVFDNAVDPDHLEPYLPSVDGPPPRVLVTSQTRSWPAAMLEVSTWAREEATTFLADHTRSDPVTADRLADVLGDLPLALEQARAYLEQMRQPAADYLTALRAELGARTTGLLDRGTPAHYQATVATTWTLSLTQARQQAPAAEELLILFAFMAPEAIPRNLVSQHAQVLPRRLRRALTGQAYQEAIGVLDRFSLATATETTITVHRLVQTVTRQALGKRAARRRAGAAVRLVKAAFPADSADVQAWPTCARLLPHALATTDHASSLAADPEVTADLAIRAGGYLWWRAELGQARQRFEQALAILTARFGPNHPSVASGLNDLGNALRGLGDLPAARAHYERALGIFQARLGPDHPNVGRCLNNLGGVLGSLGELNAARQAHRRGQDILEARLGRDDPDVASNLDNLGIVLRRLGQLDAARDAHQRALAIRKRRLVPDHPDVGRSLDNLGIVLRRLGQLDAARDAHQRALELRRARLGSDHPHVAHSLSGLGSVSYELEDPAGARPHFEAALAILEARLGPTHPDVASGLGNLGNVLRGLGELPTARAHYERALAIFETRLGPDHPDTTQIRESLKTVRGELEDPSAACNRDRHPLPVLEARVGSGNPLPTPIHRNLAS
jgi:tetratricopeptide (TPR) repeat protein